MNLLSWNLANFLKDRESFAVFYGALFRSVD